MTTIEFLPHTADIRMRVEAERFEKIFHAALEGMNRLLKKNFCNGNPELKFKAQLNVESTDETCLLIDVLSEVLALSHINNVIYCKLEVKALTETKINAVIYGSAVSEFDEDIKAVTYHEANLVKNERNHWETKIIFDI